MAGAALLTLLPAGQAWAVGTAAGTDVNNTFTLEYRVNGTGTPVTLVNPGDGTHEADFVVDRMVDVLVELQTTSPGTGGQGDAIIHVFEITNEGNATQAYNLGIFENTSDAFDVTGNSTYEVSYDGGTTYTTYVPGDTTSDVIADDSILLRVTTTIPEGLEVGDVSEFAVVADTRESTVPVTGAAGDDVVASSGANGDDTVETVLRDDIGDVGGTTGVDADTDGNHSDTAVVQVDAAAEIAATKTVALIEPNSTDASCAASTSTAVAEASAVFAPGACVEYTIAVTNTGGVPVTDVQIRDLLDDDLIFISADASDLGGNFTGTGGKIPSSAAPCSASSAAIAASTTAPADCEIIMVEGTVPASTAAPGLVLVIRARVP